MWSLMCWNVVCNTTSILCNLIKFIYLQHLQLVQCNRVLFEGKLYLALNCAWEILQMGCQCQECRVCIHSAATHSTFYSQIRQFVKVCNTQAWSAKWLWVPLILANRVANLLNRVAIVDWPLRYCTITLVPHSQAELAELMITLSDPAYFQVCYIMMWDQNVSESSESTA